MNISGIACKNLNRLFIGIEIDKSYYNVTQKRLTNNTEKVLTNDVK